MTTYINPMNDLGPSLAGLADTVANFVNPNYKLQQALRAKILEDPSLAQKLADTEDAAPGTLEALGLGKLGKIISKMPPSSAEILEKTLNPDLGAFAKAHSQDILSKQTTGQTVAQNSVDTSNAQIKQTEVGAAQRQDLAAQQSQDFISKYKSTATGNTGLYGFADDVVNNRVPADTLTPILGDTSPTGRAAQTAIDVMLKLKDQQNALDIAKARDANRLNEVSASTLLNRAVEIYTKTKSGDVQSIEKILSDPKARDRANYLIDHPNEATSEDDKNLLSSMQGMNRMDEANRQSQVAAAGKNIMTLVAAQTTNEQTKGNDPAMRAQIVSSIQEQLNVRSQFGAPDLLVHYGKVPGAGSVFHPFGGNEQLYYTDQNGNVVNPNIALRDFTGVNAKLLEFAPRAYDEWKNAADKKAAYNKMISTKSGAAMAQLLSTIYPDFKP